GTKSRADQDLAPHEKALYAIADGLVGKGHLGQKSGAGFYRYEKGSRAPLDHDATHAMIAEARKAQNIQARDFGDEEIVARLLGALVNEGAHVLSEGIAARSGDVDTVWVHGYGFPRWRGGPMFAADQYGLERLADAVDGFAAGPGGEHWNIAPTLRATG
ncbi:3-hydroxyacyl-CoA dehydrogenase family protein, partial [Rhizobiaceae bacterium]|nr:3-hydroxyacyl-CoA dehydrogenase family protein [Rhizobiaceae bacterium]